MLATCRDTAGDPWRTSIADLARLPGVHILRLAPLSETAVAGLLRAAGVTADPELARFVHARSEGNALYVTTLARVLAAQPGAAADADAVARIAAGSAEVSHLVASLLRDLDDGTCALLAAASVLGADFDSGLAAAVAGTSQDGARALSAAETRGLVTRQPDRPGSWWFTHALVRDGIYASLAEDQRIALHAAAAAALEPLARNAPERGGEIAAHLLRAAPDQATLRRAAGWAATAATTATAALAFEDAVRYLATALAAAESADVGGAERAELLIELATAEYRAGQLAASLRHAVAAADAAERDGRLDLVAGAALVVRGIGHTPVALTLLGLCDRALADDRRAPPARRARLLAQRASALAELGDLDAAATGSAAAMTAAAAAGDPAAELDAIRARVAALSAPQHRAERLRLGTRAVELATPAGQPLAAVLGRVWRIDAAYQLLNLEAVDAEISQIAQLAESTRLPLARWHLLRQQASRAALAASSPSPGTGPPKPAGLRSGSRTRPARACPTYSPSGWRSSAVTPGRSPRTSSTSPRPLRRYRSSGPRLARALFAVGRTDEAQAVYETLRQLPAAGDKDTRTFGRTHPADGPDHRLPRQRDGTGHLRPDPPARQ